MTARVCAHDGSPAVAICTGCGEDICAGCHRSTLTGFALCTTCGSRIVDALRTRWESASTPWQAIYAFLYTAVAVLGSARAFFQSLPPFGPALRPLLFGSIAYAIGAEAASLWQWAFVDSFPEQIQSAADAAGLTPETAFVATLLVIPFVAPVVLLLHVGLLHGSLRIFGAPTNLALVSRIVGYSSAAYLFQLVPPIAEFPIGHMLAIVWLVNVQMVAVRRYFELGVWQSMAAVFVPFFIMMGFGALA